MNDANDSDIQAQIVDALRISQRINHFLLLSIDAAGLTSVPVGMKGRSVAEIFAHLHNTRLMWLNEAAPNLMEGLAKLEVRTETDKAKLTQEVLDAALTASDEAVETVVLRGLAVGKIKGFKPHLSAFVGYLISHESYHRGEICMTLTLAGRKLPDTILYGQWEWGTR